MKSSDFESLELTPKASSSTSLTSKDTIKFGSSNRRKKYLFLAGLAIVVIAALAVGLAVGLGRDDDDDQALDDHEDDIRGAVRNIRSSTLTPLPRSTTGRASSPAPVLLVSLDGFRASYLSYDVTPHLQTLIGEGAHTPRLLSAYPSLTFPNHYTIVTGLYPESHGIIDNKMFDISFQRLYKLGSPEAAKPDWYQGEPIWLTAQRQGKRSACFFWVASDVPIQGEYPTEYRKYNSSVSFEERVDTVVQWLSRPADSRPHLITLYFNEPDHTGHAEGPGAGPEMLKTLKMVDDTVGRLVTGLKDRGLYDSVNIIIVSDHGMAARSCSRQVKLKDFFNATELRNLYVFSSASGRIGNRYKYSGRGNFTIMDTPVVSKETILSRLSGAQPHLAVYDKAHLPRRLHYANNVRIDDVVVKMDEQWVFSRSGSSGSYCSGGTHGWDTRYASMSGLFIARGPAFKEGVVIPPFENIELYNLMTDMLQIAAAPNNGTRGSLHAILRNPPHLDQRSEEDLVDHHPTCRHHPAVSAADLRTHCNCTAPSSSHHTSSGRTREDLLRPAVPEDERQSTVCVSDPAHFTVYSRSLHMPLFTSFTISKQEDLLQPDADSCIVPSSVLAAEERDLYRLYDYHGVAGVTSAALFTDRSSCKNVTHSDDLLTVLESLKQALRSCGSVAQSTDVVPMLKSLKQDLWRELWHMVGTVTNSSLSPVAVTVGPVFDHDYDGLADDMSSVTRFADKNGQVPMPSHYFAVLARCPEDGQDLRHCVDDLDLLSFVLPNEQTTNGQRPDRRLLENVARVKDVELLTGLTFFPDLDPAVRSRLVTRVPMALWKKPGSWEEQDLCSTPEDVQCDSSYQPLLLISLDGFRADYLVKYNRTPTLDRLIRCGVHAPYMRSVYPTKTFPNHYTIVTGLYPESHGIVDNNMYDVRIGQKFCLSCEHANDPAWWGGEPIWLTAKRHNLTTAAYFWPGTDIAINGEYPDYYKPFKDGVSYSERIQTVLHWLKLPADQRPQFITLYFDEPDHTGHVAGPDSPQIGEKLAEVDAALSELMEGLYQQNRHHCVNIIVVADHGMSGISCDRLIPLTLDLSRAEMANMYVYDGPVGRISNKYRYGRDNNVPIDPPKINVSTIVEALECSDRHMRVFPKQSFPLRHHYVNNPRIDDVILDADDHWTISRSGSTRYCKGGNHGYDNLYASMHALFIAYGPAFKVGVEVEPFENIELYNLMTDILRVPAAPNNGTEGVLLDVLRVPPPPSLVNRPSSSSQPSSSPQPTCGDNETDSTALRQKQQDICRCSRAVVKTPSDWNSTWNEPVAASGGPSFCVSRYADHAVAYDQQMMAPAWLTFNVPQNSTLAAGSAPPCVVRDTWLPGGVPTLNTSLLKGTAYTPGSLHFGFEDDCEAVMSSHVVPMLPDFRTGLWREVEQLVADYSARYGDVAVTVGPVFNDHATGLWTGRTDSTRIAGGVYPVPTHFFVVLARCGEAGSESFPCWDSLQLLPFLLPHEASASNCQSFGSWLRQNVARLRDIELATGLQFFPQLPLRQAARLRTFLPTRLWEGSAEATSVRKPGNWTEQPCPPRDQADRQCPSDYQPVLLVSLDGFKPQYLGRGFTPVIDRLLSCGVHAPYMRSVYPTKTFPNHYTIVTGLYPESHGIIDNNMFDFDISQKKFSISSDIKNDPRWWRGEPIWLTAKKQNVTSASYFWVGSDVPIQGSYPDLFKYYAGSAPYSSRVSTIVEWMQLPADRRPQLLMLYFDEPDHQAHTSGPFTAPVDEQLQRVDGIIGQLMEALYQNDLHHCVNLILLSDHGFSSLSCDQVIEMQDYFNRTQRDDLYFYYGPFGRISNTYRRNKDGSAFRYEESPPMSVEDVLGHLQCVDHLKVYNKADLPVRHHYTNSERIDNIILDPALNWTVSDKINRRYCSGGSHGWDNTCKAMEALFVGYGPAFKNGETVQPFENIELYNMISDLLGIRPAPNNGTEGSLDHMQWRFFARTRQAAASYSAVSSLNAGNSTVVSCRCAANASESGSSSGAILQDLLTSSQNAPADVNQQHQRTDATPFGAPLLMTSELGQVPLLYQPTHVTAYSAARRLPVWVSGTVSSSTLKKRVSNSSCVVADPRMSSGQCGTWGQLADNVSLVSLLPSGYDLGPTASLLSSHVPMEEDFYTGVWRSLQSYLSRWSAGGHDLNVIAGPAFDGDRDGQADTADTIVRLNVSVPTHVFLIASRCGDSSRPLTMCDNLETLSFILPQVDTSKQYNCQSAAEYLTDNEARVRDVELLTGLHFFPALPFTQAVALRTYLPSGLWP